MRSPGSDTAHRSSRATSTTSFGEHVTSAEPNASQATSAVRLATKFAIAVAWGRQSLVVEYRIFGPQKYDRFGPIASLQHCGNSCYENCDQRNQPRNFIIPDQRTLEKKGIAGSGAGQAGRISPSSNRRFRLTFG
jgi:hypothetical protein